MRVTTGVALTATFTALVVGSNFGLADVPNVKLDAVVVFIATLAFGVRIGASVAVLSEIIWSQVSPWGVSGTYLLPFLVTAELFYLLAGWVASRAWKSQGGPGGGALFFGGLLTLSTFLWDVWTNLGTALLLYWPSVNPLGILIVEFNPGALAFNLLHEGSNLILGLFLAPVVVRMISRELRTRHDLSLSSGR